jgi:tRNA threonylcarbamoyladenosine biosynthesis protein TsaB
MVLLVIDTSTDQPAVGLLPPSGPSLCAPPVSSRRHGRDLVPAIRDLLTRASVSVNDVRAVAVGLGPGSYTGLRIGLTAARMLAYVASSDLIGFDSLEGWARLAPVDACRVHVVGDAQRGDVYSADFVRSRPGEPLRTVTLSRIESLSTWRMRLEEPGLVLGPGLDSQQIRSAVPPGLATLLFSPDHPRAVALLDLARELWEAGHRDDLWTLEPRYLRRSAAEDLWEARGRKP